MNDDAQDESGGLTAGQLLAQARQARSLSVEEVAAQLKLSSKSVQAIEADRHESLPGLTFVRGFARNYARLVGLDAAQVLALLPAMPAPEPDPAPDSEPSTARPASVAVVISTGRRRRSKPLLLAALVLFILGGAGAIITRSGLFAPPPRLDDVGSSASGDHAPVAALPASPQAPASPASASAPASPASVPAPASPAGAPAPASTQAGVPASTPAGVPASAPAGAPAPAAAPAAAAPAAPAAPNTSTPVAPALPDMSGVTPAPASAHVTAAAGHLAITASGSTWVSVRDAGGHTLWSGMMTAGSRRSLNGRPPLHMVIGNAPAAQILYNGHPVDLAASTSGKVARVTLE